MTSSTPAPSAIARSTLLRRAAAWTTLLTGAASLVALMWWGYEMALGVALGALVGFANLWLLSRAVAQLVDNAGDHRPAPGRKWSLPAVLLLKWPFVLLALAGILWYMPARPEGVALGLVLSLAAASVAAAKGRSVPPEAEPDR